MSSKNDYTPVELKMLELLSDGEPHLRSELHACCEKPDCDEHNAIKQHLFRIRKKIRKEGYDIVCCIKNRRIFYRWMRQLNSPNTPAVKPTPRE